MLAGLAGGLIPCLILIVAAFFARRIWFFICLLLGLVLFFSKKKVIEISFTDKRICVPQKSMSSAEYQTLYQTLIHTRNQNRGHKIEK